LTEEPKRGAGKPEPPPDASFLPMLFYVLGFMLVLAALAFLAAWLWWGR